MGMSAPMSYWIQMVRSVVSIIEAIAIALRKINVFSSGTLLRCSFGKLRMYAQRCPIK